MNAPELLNDLESKGVRVRLVGDRIRVEGPRDVVGPAIRDEVAARKPELVEALRHRDAGHREPALLPIPPATRATLQRFPLPSPELLVAMEARFLENGVQPSPDDLRAATWLEDYLARWRELLDDLYAGSLTFAYDHDSIVVPWPRGLPS
ncbi:MAG TPA: hypothetical protein VK714_00450 [Myxococcota bacterium]|nr:hypothetical protein [Myxococcota bacterium]